MPPEITKEAVETAAISVSNKATIVGGSGAALSTFLHSNLLGLAGVALAVLGFLTSLYFQKRRDLREQRLLEMEEQEDDRREREHVRRMEKMMSKPVPLDGGPP
jgi:hypothetical protein